MHRVLYHKQTEEHLDNFNRFDQFSKFDEKACYCLTSLTSSTGLNSLTGLMGKVCYCLSCFMSCPIMVNISADRSFNFCANSFAWVSDANNFRSSS